MSAPTGATQPAASTTAATTTAAATTANATATTAAMSGTVSTMADLQQQSPEVYNAMMQGIAMIICGDMQNDEADLEKMEEEFREEDES